MRSKTSKNRMVLEPFQAPLSEVVVDADGVPLQLQFPWPLEPGDIEPADIENYRIPCGGKYPKEGKKA